MVKPDCFTDRSTYSERLQSLNFWRELDPFTKQHSLRVRQFVGLLGQFAGLNENLIADARDVALIHDLGKAKEEAKERLFLPKEETTFGDIVAIHKHPLYGAIRARKAKLSELYVQVILHHHEENDGGGYPSGWTREQTVLALGEDAATIIDLIRIADSFDSMAYDHYVLKGKGVASASEEILMQMESGKYNRAYRDAFMQLVQTILIPSQKLQAG